MVFVVKHLHDVYTFNIIINNFIIHNLFSGSFSKFRSG